MTCNPFILRLSLPAVVSTIVCAMLLPSCSHGDKPTMSHPVRVEVQVIGNKGASAAQAQGRQYSGTIESASTSQLSFSSGGTITSLNTKIGSKVAKGQVLGTVKDGNATNAHNIAAAELEEARDAYRRLKQLHDANALAEVKWVEVQQKLKQAENAEAMAARLLDDSKIVSPISGYISEKFAEVGQTVLPSQPVIAVVSLEGMQMSASVPEEEIAGIYIGDEATIVVNAAKNITAQGKVVEKAVVADPLTRAYTVKFNISDPANEILPGMTGNIYLKSDTVSEQSTAAPATFTLPSQAVLLNSDNRQFVWIVKDGASQQRYVTANELALGGGVRIESGLASGDSVIVAGMPKVSTGTIVEVVNSLNNQ